MQPQKELDDYERAQAIYAKRQQVRAQSLGDVAVKFDQDKLRFELIPPLALESVAAAFTYGAKKYGQDNWRQGIGFSYRRCLGAMMRHAWRWSSGKNFDLESGAHHLACVAFYCLILIEYHIKGKGIDDRIK